MKAKKSGKWLLGLGLATLVSLSGMAQHNRSRHHDDMKGHHRNENSGKKDLSDKVYRITQADSVQKQKLKPAVDHASKRLESLRLSYQKQEKRVLDSLSVQAKSILKDDQWQKLNNWKNRTGGKR